MIRMHQSLPDSSQRLILQKFQPGPNHNWAPECAQRDMVHVFSSRPECGPRSSPQTYFEACPAPPHLPPRAGLVGFVSGGCKPAQSKKLIVFPLGGNNYKVCKWRQQACKINEMAVFILAGNNCRVRLWRLQAGVVQETWRFSNVREQM